MLLCVLLLWVKLQVILRLVVWLVAEELNLT